MTREATKELLKSETGAVFLHLLKINIEGEDSLYFVDNNEYIRSNGVDYMPVAFKVVLPSDEKTPCQIVIDNVDRQISLFIKNHRKKQVTVAISIIIAQNPDVVERGPMNFILRNIKIDSATVSGELYDFYIYDRKIPEGSYRPSDFPGLF